jgi:hypothetical protein
VTCELARWAGCGKIAVCVPSPALPDHDPIRSYLSTAAKHGLHFFDALVMLTEGPPWMPAAI